MAATAGCAVATAPVSSSPDASPVVYFETGGPTEGSTFEAGPPAPADAAPSGRVDAGGLTCGTGLALCSGRCVNLATDSSNCGTCGTTCGAGLSCGGGSCACPSGLANCGGSCVDLSSSSSHCGACSIACAPSMSCGGGSCACPSGESNCSGACVNLLADSSDCGACGVACTASGTTCASGSCACSSAGPDTCTTATNITGGGTVSGSTCGCGTSPVPMGCGGAATSPEQFYTYTATTGQIYFLSISPGFTIQLLQGDCFGDAGCSATGGACVTTTSGGQIWLVIATTSGACASYTLSVSIVSACP